nr:hypothetical protein RAR13_18595 [Aminobacter aminovorans]
MNIRNHQNIQLPSVSTCFIVDQNHEFSTAARFVEEYLTNPNHPLRKFVLFKGKRDTLRTLLHGRDTFVGSWELRDMLEGKMLFVDATTGETFPEMPDWLIWPVIDAIKAIPDVLTGVTAARRVERTARSASR